MVNQKVFLDKLIYVDSDFISSKYEEIKKVSPETHFSRTEGLKADGGIGVLNAGIYSQETKTFMLSSVKMLQELYGELESYPKFQPENFKNNEGTQAAWIEGRLTIGWWGGSEEKDKSPFRLFEVKSNEHKHFSLIVQPESFSSNIGALLTVDSVLLLNFGIQVKLLGRILYLVEDIPSFVVCPYVIIEP